METPVPIQLAELEDKIWNMEINFDIEMWQELDGFCPCNKKIFYKIIDDIFTEYKERYKMSKPVLDILEEFYVVLRSALWVGMNIPCPEFPMAHIYRLSENMIEIFHENYYTPLATEMHYAHRCTGTIQRFWRRCRYDPRYETCRRMLFADMAEIERDIAENLKR